MQSLTLWQWSRAQEPREGLDTELRVTSFPVASGQPLEWFVLLLPRGRPEGLRGPAGVFRLKAWLQTARHLVVLPQSQGTTVWLDVASCSKLGLGDRTA